MGNRELRQMLIVVRRLWGHSARPPSAVSRQSIDRTSVPISPAPARNSSVGWSRTIVGANWVLFIRFQSYFAAGAVDQPSAPECRFVDSAVGELRSPALSRSCGPLG